MLLRQVTAAIGLISIAGHAQTVKPLVAPMAEAAAELKHGDITDDERDRVRALTAATDNIALFFGEDVFLAIGSILLMVGFMQQSGIEVQPLELSFWALPTAIAAFFVHGARLLLFDRTRLKTKSGGREMITLHYVYVLVGAAVRRVRRFERARYGEPEAVDDRALLGAVRGRAFWRAISWAISATAFSC